MLGIPMNYVLVLVVIFLIGAEMDVFKTFKTHMVLKAGLEASTLAGATQQEQIITEKSPTEGNAPIQFGYYLKQDGSPAAFAMDTWNKNLSQWSPGSWTSSTPVFSLSRKATSRTPEGQLDTVSVTMDGSIPMTMSNKNFSANGSTPFQIETASTVFNTEETTNSTSSEPTEVINTVDEYVEKNLVNTIDSYLQQQDK